MRRTERRCRARTCTASPEPSASACAWGSKTMDNTVEPGRTHMRAARILSCVVLLAGWATAGYAANGQPAAPSNQPRVRVAKPAKREVVDNTQRIDVNNI